ncbi:MAG: hypothetical protein ACOC92_00205 [bacterium]
MKPALARLRAEVRADREAVFRWLDDLEALTLQPGADPGTLARAAWSLHHAYSGIEAILERTMRTIEGSLPEGPDSHKALLDAAALTIEGIREPLLSEPTVDALHELRGFRHFVRHAYAVKLDPGRLADLQRRSAALRPRLEADLDRLDEWLQEVAQAVD